LGRVESPRCTEAIVVERRCARKRDAVPAGKCWAQKYFRLRALHSRPRASLPVNALAPSYLAVLRTVSSVTPPDGRTAGLAAGKLRGGCDEG
jgi:hypothetical protein